MLSVRRDEAGVRIATDMGAERFDKVILAAHSDESLALLGVPSAAERDVLGAIRYQPNRAVLHTEASVLPTRKLAWAAWNYERAQSKGSESAGVCLHYLLNMLQPLPFAQPVVVSPNPVREIARKHTMGEYNYAHPVFDLAAIRAQKCVPLLQGLPLAFAALPLYVILPNYYAREFGMSLGLLGAIKSGAVCRAVDSSGASTARIAA